MNESFTKAAQRHVEQIKRRADQIEGLDDRMVFLVTALLEEIADLAIAADTTILTLKSAAGRIFDQNFNRMQSASKN